MFAEADAREEHLDKVVEQTYQHIVRRRHWFKAFELLQELVCKAYQTIEKNEQRKKMQKQNVKTEYISTSRPEFL